MKETKYKGYFITEDGKVWSEIPFPINERISIFGKGLDKQ